MHNNTKIDQEKGLTMMMPKLLVAVGVALAITPIAVNAQEKIRFGMAISKTGQNTPGAQGTVTPNYRLWIGELQAAGGITIKKTGKKVPIALIEYDDRSQSGEVVRLTERMINEDKVDFVLSPWGTAFNLAVAHWQDREFNAVWPQSLPGTTSFRTNKPEWP